MEKDDKQLIADYLNGSEESFEQLVKIYLKPVYNFLFQMTSDKSAIDDLTQETFIKAWKNIKRYDPAKSFKTWLFVIAKNTAFDYFKKKKTIPFSFLESEDNDQFGKIQEDRLLPDEILEQKDLALEIEKKLKEIPAHYRIILLMHYQDDFSLQEIAEILGKPYNTIKSQHNRALHSLKNLFL